MASLQPHAESQIATQNAALDRMVDTLSRLESMAGNWESEFEQQGLEIERLEAEVRAQEREAAQLSDRGGPRQRDRSQTAELWCWILMIASAVLAFVFYSLLKKRGFPGALG